MDNSKEGLMLKPKKPSLSSSFDPISEKQEEMSVSTIHGNNQNKIKNSFKNSKDNIAKSILDDIDIMKHSSTQKNKQSGVVNNHKNNFINQMKEENKKDMEHNKNNNIDKNLKKKEIKKREKRNSALTKKTPLTGLGIIQLNSSERNTMKLKKKGSLGKQVHFFNNSILNKSFHNLESSFSKQFSIAKSITNSAFEIKYLNNIKQKKTILHKGKLEFNEKTETKIFEQVKNSDYYEKSEYLLFKLKICYGILAIFSLISIILNFSDAIIYNNNSLNYLYKENNNSYNFYENSIESYYCINNRKITSKENNIRLFNGIFSLICVLILIIIHYFKNVTGENKKINTKKERFKRMLDQYYSKQRKKSLAKNKLKQLKQEEERLKNEKIKVVDFDQENKEFKNTVSIIHERKRTILACILNIIFYPPFINKSFIGKYDNIVYIYSLNSFFLIISLYKITNIYTAIFYLSSINNSFNKAICKSNLINLDAQFLFKYNLKRSPIIFLIINLIIIFISVCIVLYCIDFFSLNINENFWNNNLNNKGDTFLYILHTFFFFIIRNIHEAHNIKSPFGTLYLFFGGLLGMLISSYLIYYANILIEFSPEEQNAYSKLTKLFNPINKEHKASNLIKSILLLKKVGKDNQNTEKDYKLKLNYINRPTYNQRKPIFQRTDTFQFVFNSNRTNPNILNMNDVNKSEEKKKFIKYIISLFLFKTKCIVECKDFTDNFKIARNSSLSFNDVLKTIGNKMDANITQLNNKIEILIQNDQKFLRFIKFTTVTINNIKKLNKNHNYILQYLVDIHNEYVKQIIEIKKETELNSPIIHQHSTIFPKRMKSNIFGNIKFKNKINSKFADGINKKKKLKKDMYDFNTSKFTVKKQKSSMQFSYLNEGRIKKTQSKHNIKSSKSRNKPTSSSAKKRTKSLDDFKFVKNELKDKAKGRKSSVRKRYTSSHVVNQDNVTSK